MIVNHDGRHLSAVTATPEWCAALTQYRWHLLTRGRPIPQQLDDQLDDLEVILRLADCGNTPSIPNVEAAPSQWVNVSTATQLLRVPARTVRHRCATGRYPGARMLSGAWHIPLTDL